MTTREVECRLAGTVVLAGTFDDDILRTLREIRELLTDIARKLDKTRRG